MIIAQISDIHAIDGASSLGVLERLSFWLDAIRPDAIIISGDLADAPHAIGYKLLGDILADMTSPIYMIPGNADNRDLMRAAFPEVGYWPDFGPMNFAVTLDRRVRLIGFDVTVPGQHYGDALPGLLWLGETLQAEPDLPTLIMMHQHPFPSGIAELDENMCRNVDKFPALLAAAPNVLAVVCGHGHRPIFSRLGAVPAMMCSSLSPANPLLLTGRGEPLVIDVPGLLVHEFGQSGLTSHVVSAGWSIAD